jgi:hypothetical protein
VFGLTIDDFRVAGGLLVLLIALSMLHGSPSAQHPPSDRELANADTQDIAICPLTIPLLVGPGSIATLIVSGHTAMTEGRLLAQAADSPRSSRRWPPHCSPHPSSHTFYRPRSPRLLNSTADGDDPRRHRHADDHCQPAGVLQGLVRVTGKTSGGARPPIRANSG